MSDKEAVETPRECHYCGDPADLRFTRDIWLCPDHWETETGTGGSPSTNAEAAEKSRERLAGCADAE